MHLGTTSEPPVRCPALIVLHHGVLARSTACVHATIAKSEYMLCKLSNLRLSKTFYKHQGLAYRNVGNLLSDQHASFGETFAGLVSLQMHESVAGTPGTQTIHRKAMYAFVDMHGGYTDFMMQQHRRDIIMEPLLYCTTTVYSEPDDWHGVKDGVDSFLDCLRQIRSWRSLACCQPDGLVAAYVRRNLLLKTSDPQIPHHRTGDFLFLFSLCMTYVRFKMLGKEVKEFLQSLVWSLQQSIDISRLETGLEKASPIVTLSAVSSLRRLLQRDWTKVPPLWRSEQATDNFDIEVHIADHVVQAAKVYVNLSFCSQSRLTEAMTMYALAVVEGHWECDLKEVELEDIRSEIVTGVPFV